MRKLNLQMQVSVDGFVAGINGELDWMLFNWDDVITNYVIELTGSMDTIVLGRKLAEGFIPYWKNVATDTAHAEHAAGKIFTDTKKIVFSKTLKNSLWENTTLQNDIETIKHLKNKEGKDIMVYGGASFVASLIKHDLIDEYHLFINPVAINNGLRIFDTLTGNKKLTLMKATSSTTGIIILHYEPVR